MFKTIFSYLKNSYEFTKKERHVLMMFLNFFKYEIPEGNGSYIAMLDLDKIKFTWCPTMELDDDGVFGAWTVAMPDRVFVRPAIMSFDFVSVCHADNLSKKEKERADFVLAQANLNYVQFRNLNFDQELLKFVFHLCEGDGIILATIFHELYHKWQFSSAKFLYLVNLVAFKLFGYKLSTKSKWSLEGDVRIYIDNDALHKVIGSFHKMFYSYLYSKNKLVVMPDDEMAKTVLDELKRENARMFKFIEQVYDMVTC